MITDAAFFGVPIHLLRLEGGDAKFDRLHEAFIEAGCARWFEGHIEQWTYPPVRDAGHVADAVLKRM
jgi:mitochondrial fission protein ELM1